MTGSALSQQRWVNNFVRSGSVSNVRRQDRYAARSTIVTSQIPVEKWRDLIGEPTFADAILDHVVHNAYKLKLKGGLMRKTNSQLAQADRPQA
jgi:hypothetical protein